MCIEDNWAILQLTGYIRRGLGPVIGYSRDSDEIGRLFRVKTAGSSDANQPPCRSEATLAF